MKLLKRDLPENEADANIERGKCDVEAVNRSAGIQKIEKVDAKIICNFDKQNNLQIQNVYMANLLNLQSDETYPIVKNDAAAKNDSDRCLCRFWSMNECYESNCMIRTVCSRMSIFQSLFLPSDEPEVSLGFSC